MTIKVTRTRGSVFATLGFGAGEATNLRLRAELVIALRELIEQRGLTQAKAASVLGVTQPRISDLVRGKVDRFSVDTLVAMLGHAGAEVRVSVRSGSRVA